MCQLYPSLSPYDEVVVDQHAACGVIHLHGLGSSVDHISWQQTLESILVNCNNSISKQHLLLQVHYFFSLESPRSLGCSKLYACSLAVVDRALTSLTSCQSAVQHLNSSVNHTK